MSKTTKTSAFMKPMQPSAQLAEIVGTRPLPRTEVTKRLWEYIKEHNLQDASDKRIIVADAVLKRILGKTHVNMFEMTKLVGKHLSNAQ